jgi:transcriptional regulator with XRE-family HTH domain
MSDSNAQQLGRLIYQHRMAAGMSQEVLAKAAQMHLSTISRIESGAFESPDPLKLQRLASALGTDAEDYFALAGYFTPHGLPGLAPYLRAKFGAAPEVVREVESYFDWLQQRSGSANPADDQEAA